MRRPGSGTARAAIALLSTWLLIPASAIAQTSQAEHESHHPGPALQVGETPPVTPAAAERPAAGPTGAVPALHPALPPSAASARKVAEGMEGMGGMEGMEGMMGGARTEVYPHLAQLPDWTPKARADVERLAEERIYEGTILLQSAEEQLDQAIRTGDHDAAERAMQRARDGLGRLDSGVAAHRLVRQGASPRDFARHWYRRSMGLEPVAVPAHGIFGLSSFHYVIMFILVSFSAMMLAMAYFRTRRASALVTKLAASPAFLRGPPSPTPAPVNPDIAPSRPNSWSGPLLVGQIFQETRQVKTFRLVDAAGGKLPFNYLPGQFLTFTVSPHGQAIKRSYTISSSPTHRDFCEVTVKHEEKGVVSGYLNDLVHVGELLQVTAPSGKFTFAGENASSIVLIAGGVGVTPMMSVIRYLTDRSWPGEVYLVYGCKSADEVIFREELEYLMRRYPNLRVTLVAESADVTTWPYAVGRISSELLATTVPGIAARRIHICGPPAMMDAVKLMLAGLGVAPGQIATEVFIGKERPQSTAPAPEASSSNPAAASASAATSAVATFVRSNKTASLPPDKTVLEASEDVGVDIEYSCRVGTCGICKVKLLSGTVTMEVQDGLEPADKLQNMILACQARATGDVSVDA
jgi:ferredoxin-NADP reductase